MLNSVAGATTGDLGAVLATLDNLPAASDVQTAYKQISPEKAGAFANLGFVAATSQMRNLATRTTNLRFVQGESSGGGGLNSGGLRFNYSQLEGMMLAYNGASLSQGNSTFNFQTDAAKRNFAPVGANVTVGLTKNLYAQINYNAEVGRANSTVQYTHAGLRYEF
jgi:hypothetical protein